VAKSQGLTEIRGQVEIVDNTSFYGIFTPARLGIKSYYAISESFVCAAEFILSIRVVATLHYQSCSITADIGGNHIDERLWYLVGK